MTSPLINEFLFPSKLIRYPGASRDVGAQLTLLGIVKGSVVVIADAVVYKNGLAEALLEGLSEAGYIPLVTLSPQWEQNFAEAIVSHGDDKQLSMAPSKLQEFIVAVRQAFERFNMVGETPVLLTSPAIRPYVRSIIERFRPATVVMSQNEVHPKARIKTLGHI